jgi:hypothetical protein
MRSPISPALVGFTLACALFAGQGSALAAEATPESEKTQTVEVPEQKKKPSTLSSLGIDFGAAELGRYAELGLSEEQKQEALRVMRERKPTIEKLCTRMTKALVMAEATVEAKEAKAGELQAIVEQFRLVQSKIMTGLHAVLTPEQTERLEAIKKQERQVEAKNSASTD